MRDRRALPIEILPLGIRADQRVQVSRLEFVGVARKSRQIADPVMTGAAPEIVAKRERGKRRVSPGAAAGNHAAVSVHQSSLCKKSGSVDAIVDIHDAPVPVQTLAVLAAKAAAAAVVDVQNRNPPARPILDAQV